MIRLCAATHDAEKALKMRMRLEKMGYLEYALNYNSLIFALASRKGREIFKIRLCTPSY